MFYLVVLLIAAYIGLRVVGLGLRPAGWMAAAVAAAEGGTDSRKEVVCGETIGVLLVLAGGRVRGLGGRGVWLGIRVRPADAGERG